MGVKRLLLAIALAFYSISARSKPVEINFQYWGDLQEIPIVEQIVGDFNREHPGIHVTAQRAPGGGSYTQKLLVQVAGRVAPDVVFVEVQGIPPLVEKGVMMPLNPLMAKTPGFKISDWYPEVTARFTWNGNLYILPRDTAPYCVVYYNKRLFDRAHLPYPTADWSWSPDLERVRKSGMDPNKDFLSICRRLPTRSEDGKERVWAWDGGWEDFAFSNGGRYVDDTQHPTKITMNDPRVIEGIQFQANLITKYNVQPSPTEIQGQGSSSWDLFVQGRIAMRLSGIWDSPMCRKITDFDWDVVRFPRGPTGIQAWTTGGSGYGITRDCKHPQEAWEFVRYIAGVPGQTLLAKGGRAQPALIGLAHSGVWIDNLKPLHKADVVNDAPRYAVYTPFTNAWGQCFNDFTTELDNVWLGKATAKDAINRAYPIAQRHLDQYRNQPTYHDLNQPAAFAAILGLLAAIVVAIVVKARREMGPKPTRRQRRENLAGYLAIAPWIVGFAVFTAGPLAVSVVMAFCKWDLISAAQWCGLDNFHRIFTDDPAFPLSLKNTLYFTVFSVPLGVAASLALALLLNTGLRGMRSFRTIYYLPAVTSAVAASVLWRWMFNPDYGLLNVSLAKLHLVPVLRMLGMVDPKMGHVMWLLDEALSKPSLIVMSLWGAGGGMIIYLAGLQGIPRSLYEAAEMDGAGAISRFRNVTLPMLTPTIFFSLIMGFIGSFQVFTQALVMTDGGPHNSTLFYVLYLYRNAFQNLEMGYSSALAWILFVIILGVTLVQFRFSRWVYYEGAAPK